MNTLGTLLNPREWAMLIVLALLTFAVLLHPGLRGGTLVVLRHLFAKPILAVLLTSAVYVAAAVYCLHVLGLWQTKDISPTIVWMLTSAFVSVLNYQKAKSDARSFRNAALQVFALTSIFVFITDLMNISVWFWLIAIPVFSVLQLLTEVSARNPDAAPAYSLLTFVQSVLGFALIIYVIYLVANSWAKVATLETIRLFALSGALSIVFLPFIYGLMIFTSYQEVFSRIPIFIKDRRVLRRAKWKAMWLYKHDHTILERWQRRVTMVSPNTREALDQTFNDIAVAVQREKYPVPVPIEDGWGPQNAIAFLADEGLLIKEYKQLFELSQWSGSSPYLSIGDGSMPNTIGYYVTGTAEAVTRLRLTLNVNDPVDTTQVYDRFAELGRALINKSISSQIAEKLFSSSDRVEEFEMNDRNAVITLTREDWQYTRNGHRLTLTIQHHKFVEG